MSTTTAAPTVQNFHREWGPGDNGEAGDDAIFELTTGYVGEVTPSGRIPHVDVTYYVMHHEAPANLGDACPDEGVWSIEEITHSYLLDPASDYPDDPEDEHYDYEGGSDLWYWSEEAAIEACRNNFAKYDESWKLNDWVPA